MEQTRMAIRQLWETWYGDIPGWVPTNKNVLAMEEIAEANALVDDDQENGELHFDGESFQPGQERLIKLSDQVVSLSSAGDYVAARKSIGMALHTLQDFYAHSSWVEALNQKNAGDRIYPGLGYPNTMIYPLGPKVKTCSNCRAQVAVFCGDCDGNIKSIDLTSGYYSGEPAFKKKSSAKCSHGGPLDFSTMYDLGIIDSADLLFGKEYENGSISDPSAPTVYDFRISTLQPHKRDLVARAAVLDHKMHTVVMADNVHEHGKALVQARVGGNRKLYPIQILKRDSHGDEPSPDDYGWREIAIATGGHLITFPENETAEANALLDILSRPNHAEILSVAATSSEENPGCEFIFPIDSSLKSLVISTSGVSSLKLFNSNGSPYSSSSTTDTNIRRVGNTIALNFTSMTIPPPGFYRISLKSTTHYTLSISGESSLSIVSFYLAEAGGRPQHRAYFPIPSYPIVGEKSMVKAHIHGNFTDAKFEFRTKGGALIASQDTVRREVDPEDTATMFYGNSTAIPEGEFMAYLTGINDDGDEFQRVVPLMLSSSKLKLTAPTIQRMTAGEPQKVTIGLTNFNSVPDTYDVFAVDSKDSIVEVTHASVYLEPGASGSFDVHLLPKTNSTIGMTGIVFGAKGRTTQGNMSLQRFVLEPEAKPLSYSRIKYHQYANETGQLIERLKMGKKR
ncbi:hypothetical protein AOL_s00097g299 [Orbilia oligospora ATCC 24927]|uniref:Uncharacterized protein n=1 Tax=Arthrobotrys oligospora (strain ATCC 24927 / CBS 115.81 / DSM 1491) TaxID=756982 RepID=G1XIX2_ARTOA|nr:hypothetical protein AOL_s00097g299 [Orbilia oligospora ATCC 24927]EGX46873.1 hypothetical protein AOL_s00097g299 [Orbilia oligospora ATCC 24927]